MLIEKFCPPLITCNTPIPKGRCISWAINKQLVTEICNFCQQIQFFILDVNVKLLQWSQDFLSAHYPVPSPLKC